jgi:hypothetical protein
MTCLREGTIRLPDGRQTGYAEYGVRGPSRPLPVDTHLLEMSCRVRHL